MMYAQMTKIAIQTIGSMLDGITNTVAIAITSPKRES
jgi:hypothetical protein